MRGVARDVPIRVGEWEDKLDVIVVELNDYDMILNISFFAKASITIMPHLGGYLIGDPKLPGFVQGIKWDSSNKDNETESETTLPVVVRD